MQNYPRFLCSCFVATLSLSGLSQVQHLTPKAPSVPGPAFVQNKGQWDKRAQFLAQMPGMNMWITSQGAVYDFYKITREPIQKIVSSKFDIPRTARKGDVVRVSFAGASAATCSVEGNAPESGVFNYWGGKGKPVWTRDVKRYSEAQTQDLYKGIAARYYFEQGVPRYDLIVKPEGDPSKIAMKIDGAEKLTALSDGGLRIKTSVGSVDETNLLAYQGVGAACRPVRCKMIVDGNTVRFDIGKYDRSQILVIDPLLYSSYLGGSASQALGDQALSVATDGTNTYISGRAGSPDFPATTGAYDTIYGFASYQGFISSFNGSGGLNWSTFIEGGNQTSSTILEINSIALDNKSHVVFGGGVLGAELLTTDGAVQSSANSSEFAGFLGELTTDGTKLANLTYLGGTNGESFVFAVNTDGVGGDVFAAGHTQATDFEVTANAYQTTNKSILSGHGGCAFATKFTDDMKTLEASSYVGGTTGSATAYGIAGDETYPDGMYIAGTTTSTDFLALGYQKTNNTGGGTTGFGAYLSPDAKTLYASSYLGGSGYDQINSMFYEKADETVYVAGVTLSTDFPVTSGAFQTTYRGQSEGFVAEFDNVFSSLPFSTFFGGTASNTILGISEGGYYGAPLVTICGQTTSTDFPLSPGAYQTTAGSVATAFVAQLSNDISTLLYSSYFGQNNVANGVAAFNYTNAMIAGTAGTIPVSSTSFQQKNNGANVTNAFVAGFAFAPEWLNVLFPGQFTGGSNVAMTITLESSAAPLNAQISLSSNSAAFPVPSTVDVPANKNSVEINVQSVPVGASTSIAVNMTYQGQTQTDIMTILPNGVQSLKLAASSVVGSHSVLATLTLAGSSGPSGAVVKLTSDNTGAVQVPATVTVPANKTSVQFTVTTSPVTANTTAHITASNDTGTQMATLELVPPSETTMVLPLTVVGGATVQADIDLNGAAPTGGVAVTLGSSNSAVAITVPKITVPAGSTYEAFSVATFTVAAPINVNILASQGSTIVYKTIQVLPATLTSVSVLPTSVVGGANVAGTITLYGHATTGVKATLTSTNVAAVVPTSVPLSTISNITPFVITTTGVATAQVATIKATLGTASVTTTLTVTPAALSLLTLAPTAVTGGISSVGKVTLTGAAGPVGTVVSFATNNPGIAGPPKTVTVTGPSATFIVVTKGVAAAVPVVITATLGTVSKTATLTVSPAIVASITVLPTLVKGGTSSTATVTLTGLSAPLGNVVQLISSNPAVAVVPATLKVVGNKATFVITTVAVTKSTAVTITAKYGTPFEAATLTVTP
ncbi:MAG TPA: hypothetical protein VGL56_04040 [Fimbriimonadaceae bacterium]|jgi:hypothetical protein